jgi:hypothetical protein
MPLYGLLTMILKTKKSAESFSEELLGILGDNLCSVLIYGSAAGPNYNPGVSNINIAVIVKKLDFAALNSSLGLVKSYRKHKIATPLFLTKEYILNSLDVFPIEFSEIKGQHLVIWGDDVFKDLEIPLKDVRLLCEQQVKGKLLHLRQAYVETGLDAPVLKNFLIRALNDLFPVFRQLIILNGQKPDEQKGPMLGQLAGIFSLDQASFLAVYDDKNKKNVISSREVEGHYQNFLIQLENLSRHLDSL